LPLLDRLGAELGDTPFGRIAVGQIGGDLLVILAPESAAPGARPPQPRPAIHHAGQVRHKGKAELRESPHQPVTKRGRSARAVDASQAGAAPRATGSGMPGRHWGVTRQALLLDVKEALVDEFVDAEGT